MHDVSPALIPLLRNPTEGLVAGDLVPFDRFRIVVAWVAQPIQPMSGESEHNGTIRSHLP
jgi:hypothetical protein